jgi:hypothetical protein
MKCFAKPLANTHHRYLKSWQMMGSRLKLSLTLAVAAAVGETLLSKILSVLSTYVPRIMDVAREFPNASTVAVDLVPMQSTYVLCQPLFI